MASTKSRTQQTRSRTYQPEKTRSSIIEAGLKLFGANGYHGTSVGDIAKAARITKGAFYHHFQSKEELLLLIHREYADYQLKVMHTVLAANDSPAEQLRGLIRCIVEAVGRYKPNVTIFFQERRYLTSKHLAQVTAQRDLLEDTFQAVIERGIATGTFRQDLDARVTCLGIIGMCAWTYQWFSDEGRMSANEVADDFVTLLLDGLLE